METLPNKLPRCPSRLIRLALKDLKTSIDQGFEVDMNNWVRQDVDRQGPCTVCLAGSVMVQRTTALNFLTDDGTKYAIDPWLLASRDRQISSADRHRLWALSWFREGDIYQAFKTLGLDLPYHVKTRQAISSFEESPEDFFHGMENLASYLALRGF